MWIYFYYSERTVGVRTVALSSVCIMAHVLVISPLTSVYAGMTGAPPLSSRTQNKWHKEEELAGENNAALLHNKYILKERLVHLNIQQSHEETDANVVLHQLKEL